MRRIRGLDWPVGMAVVGNELYVANYGEDERRRANLTVLAWNAPRIPVASPNAWEVLSCGGRVYVTNYSDGRVTVVNPASHRVEASAGGFRGPNGIAVSHDGRLLYVVNSDSSDPARGGPGTVAILERARMSAIGSISVGPYPSQIDVAGPARGGWPCTCPPAEAGATLCVAEPSVSRGGSVVLSYRLEPGLPLTSADALLGVVLPDGRILSFSRGFSRLRAVPVPITVGAIDRVGRGLDMTASRGGTLSFRVPPGAKQGEYRFAGALLVPGTNRVVQVVYSNQFSIR